MDGWISLHRVLLRKPIWRQSTPEQKVILITLLLMANHERYEWEWMGKKYTVEQGQFITSLESIKQSAGKGVSIQNIRSSLSRFKKFEFLTDEPTKTGRMITICNWGSYQTDLVLPNKEANKEVTKTQQRGNKEVTSNNNDNNEIIKRSTNVLPCETEFHAEIIDYEKLISFFNSETKTVFGEVKYPISETRKKMISARIKEHGKSGFSSVIRKAYSSNFLKGENNRGFVATLDWLIKPTNFEKVLSGNYDNKTTGKNGKNGHTGIPDDELLEAIRSGTARAAADIAEREGRNIYQ